MDVNIGTSDEEIFVKVGVSLPTPQQERYKKKFIEHQKNFDWYYVDIPSLDTSFIMHNLPLKDGSNSIK